MVCHISEDLNTEGVQNAPWILQYIQFSNIVIRALSSTYSCLKQGGFASAASQRLRRKTDNDKGVDGVSLDSMNISTYSGLH